MLGLHGLSRARIRNWNLCATFSTGKSLRALRRTGPHDGIRSRPHARTDAKSTHGDRVLPYAECGGPEYRNHEIGTDLSSRELAILFDQLPCDNFPLPCLDPGVEQIQASLSECREAEDSAGTGSGAAIGRPDLLLSKATWQ